MSPSRSLKSGTERVTDFLAPANDCLPKLAENAIFLKNCGQCFGAIFFFKNCNKNWERVPGSPSYSRLDPRSRRGVATPPGPLCTRYISLPSFQPSERLSIRMGPV